MAAARGWRSTGRAGLLGLLILLAGPAQAACRQALVLALDVSGSVDAAEYRLQLDGVAGALRDAQVRAALLSNPDAPVSLAVMEWSGAAFQRVILPWTSLVDGPAIEAAAARVAATRRRAAPQATGIGAALRRSAALLADGPACWRRTIDVSGDGKNNDWPEPDVVRDGGTLGGVTVNALVIATGDTAAELSAYFQAEVLHGPDAFVEVALGYADYARAMKRKLLREVATVAIGLAPGDANSRGAVTAAAARQTRGFHAPASLAALAQSPRLSPDRVAGGQPAAAPIRR